MGFVSEASKQSLEKYMNTLWKSFNFWKHLLIVYQIAEKEKNQNFSKPSCQKCVELGLLNQTKIYNFSALILNHNFLPRTPLKDFKNSWKLCPRYCSFRKIIPHFGTLNLMKSPVWDRCAPLDGILHNHLWKLHLPFIGDNYIIINTFKNIKLFWKNAKITCSVNYWKVDVFWRFNY